MKLRLATRGSALALAQSGQVARTLEQRHPGLLVELIVIKTTGDIQRDAPLNTLGGKGVFTREIEVALLEGEADFAVHSLKDLPTSLPPGLTLGATPPREDPRDALAGPVPLSELPAGAVVGTGSLRRQEQLRRLRPDLTFRDIRGNVNTRVEKWKRGDYPGGVVLAMAGVHRLGLDRAGLENHELHPLSTEACLPAPCQGILGLECRQDDTTTQGLLAALEDPSAHWAARSERAFLAALGGGCNLPAGALAEVVGDLLTLTAVLGTDPADLKRIRLSGPLSEGEALGVEAARTLAG